jgi:hypothetical protein
LKIFYWVGPTCQRPHPHRSPPTQSPCGDRTHGGERAGMGHRRCQCRGGPYPPLRRVPSPFLFLPPPTPLLLCLILGRRIAPHHQPPPSTVIVVTTSTCSSNREPESPANGDGQNHLLSHRLALTASPSTAAVPASPASPPRLGGPCESVAQPCLHLCR